MGDHPDCPTCAVLRIKRAGRDVAGEGVTAALLRQEDIQVRGLE